LIGLLFDANLSATMNGSRNKSVKSPTLGAGRGTSDLFGGKCFATLKLDSELLESSGDFVT